MHIFSNGKGLVTLVRQQVGPFPTGKCKFCTADTTYKRGLIFICSPCSFRRKK